MIKLLKIHVFKHHSPIVLLIIVLTLLQTLSELALPTLMAEIVNHGVVLGQFEIIEKTGLAMLGVAVVGTLCAIAVAYLSSRTSSVFAKDLRHQIFEHTASFSMAEFDQIGTSSLITRTTNDVNQVQVVVQMMLRLFVSAPLMCIGGIVLAVSKDRSLAMILVLVMPLLALVFYGVSRKSTPLFKAVQEKLDHLTGVIRENLTGLRVIRAFDRTHYERERFTAANKDLTDTAIQVSKWMALTMPSMLLLLNLSLIVTVWAGSVRIDQGYLQVGDLMAFIQYIMQIMFSFLMLALMFVVIPRAMVSATRIHEVLEKAPQIKDPVESLQLEDLLGHGDRCETLGERSSSQEARGVEIEFKNVSFSYAGAETPALCNISFVAEAGKKTALIGGTGSGKTTLINLIPRFYEVQSGAVLINGIDVRAMTQMNLRSQIGLVPQRSALFNGTIAENLQFGKPDATEDDMIQAAKTAQALDFILEGEEGFDAFTAQGGRNLSGGQQQRIAIARALIKKPALYIFDDSFSALDLKTDALLRQALRADVEGATLMMVAQRVSTIRDADQILVLHEGQIVGRGKHHQLLENCTVYQEIVASQETEVADHE